MPTQKDIEFAKLLISKDLISRAAMQRILDELDTIRKQDTKITIEAFVIKNKIITNHELNALKASGQQRVVHCNKCRTMYRVNSEDVGKRFKCKTCGTAVIVPMPGQTESKSVKELVDKKATKTTGSLDSQKILKGVSKEEYEESLKKQVPPSEQPKNIAESNPELTINLDADDEDDEFQNASPAGAEATINLGLDDEDEENAIMIDDSKEVLPEVTLQIKDNSEYDEDDSDAELIINGVQVENTHKPEVTINLGEDDEDFEEDDYGMYNVAKVSSPKQEPTINLGLDDADYDEAELVEDEESQQHELAVDLSYDFSETNASKNNPEPTINLGLDDSDYEEDDSGAMLIPDEEIPYQNQTKRNNPEPTINLGLDDSNYEENDSDGAMLIPDEEIPYQNQTKRNNPEPTINLGDDEADYEEDDSDGSIVISPDAAIQNHITKNNPEPTINLGLDDSSYEEDDSDGAMLIPDEEMRYQNQTKRNNPEPTINLGDDEADYEEDDSDGAIIISPDVAIQNHITKNNPEPTINLGLDEEDAEDAELVEDELPQQYKLTQNQYEEDDLEPDDMIIPTGNMNKNNPEPTINLGLDEEDIEDAELVEDELPRHNELTLDLSHDVNEYEEDDSDGVIEIDEIEDTPQKNNKKNSGEMTISLGLDDEE